ncbi:hypothetical protein FRC96_19395 [Lujinxingia vulgaris]|uniref:Transposase IS200-like domain-containing protein n=1 Tax=Lujinxingia vulgaris TaxID=2600176 RepID=A0A5C6WUC8_9DELT|nr:transposase [Lujinxingia vulgaris]TXD31989.1 hypothetical protein FRC96_19395 [Lujinxingia vulgaris]
MGRPLRIQDPSHCYFVTNRCFQERFFLTPTPEINALILGWLARAAKRYDVEIFFFLFMSNHFHLAVRAPRENLHRFMGYFQCNLAGDVNQILKRTGSLFARRYSAEPMLDDDAMMQKWRYTMTNPVEANLVSHVRFWPGQSSYQAHMDQAPINAVWTDRDKLRALRRRKNHVPEDEVLADRHIELHLAPLPFLKDHTPVQRTRFFKRALSAHTRVLTKHRNKRGEKVLGAINVRTQNPLERPKNPARSPRPLCHTRCPIRRNTYRKHVREITEAYRAANALWREGHLPTFPPGTIPPGWSCTTSAPDIPPPYSSTSASSVQ